MRQLQMVFFLAFFALLSCKTKMITYNDNIEVYSQFSQLQAIIDSDKNKIWVVNFWATTCPPCIREMPHFKALDEDYRNKNVKVLLISLDRVKDLENRVVPFVSKHAIVPEVGLLGDDNYSAWTEKIDPSWYGALPATVIIKGDKRKFKMGQYNSLEELEADLKEFL